MYHFQEAFKDDISSLSMKDTANSSNNDNNRSGNNNDNNSGDNDSENVTKVDFHEISVVTNTLDNIKINSCDDNNNKS